MVPLSRTAARFRKGGCCDRKGPSNVTVKQGNRGEGERKDTESTTVCRKGPMSVYVCVCRLRSLADPPRSSLGLRRCGLFVPAVMLSEHRIYE